MKKFFKKTEGFTLVELIVVIAILGILAGVGTVGYSGYIKKANLAADKQIVSVINQALTAACVENGVTTKSVTSATLAWGGEDDNAVTGLSELVVEGDVQPMALSTLGVKAQQIVDAFAKYYAGNENNEFKLTDATRGLTFVKGAFYHPDDIDGIAQAVQETVAVYKQSNFSGNETALVESMKTLSGGLVSWLNGKSLSAYATYFATSDNPDAYNEFATKYGITDETSKEEVANATVAYVASQAANMDAAEIATALSNPSTGVGTLINEYGQLTTAALLYGVMTGYANSDYASSNFKNTYSNAEIDGVSDIFALMDQLGASSEQAYLGNYMNTDNEKNAVNDISGYLSAMEVVNAYEGSLDLSDTELFDDPATLALIQKVLGSN